MLTDFISLAAGLALLVFAGDMLVKGAVALSLRLGVPAIVVSLTVVAFGTSAPEMLVSVQATMDGLTGLVYGNVVGSNIANILLVLGLPAIIAPVHLTQRGVRRNYFMMLGASAALIIACFMGGLTFTTGLVFLALLAAMLIYTYFMAQQGKFDVNLEEEECLSPLKTTVFILGGVAGLPLGAHLLIEGAESIAVAMGVSEAAIGLTLVAVGTSLPELATTVMAAVRKQTDVAIGNVLGSNIFNILGVFGVAALVGDQPVPPGFLQLDLWVMLAAALLIGPYLLRRANIGRVSGVVFCCIYVVFCVLALGPRM